MIQQLTVLKINKRFRYLHLIYLSEAEHKKSIKVSTQSKSQNKST